MVTTGGPLHWVQPSGIRLWQSYAIGGIVIYTFVALYIKANLPMSSWHSILPGLLGVGLLTTAAITYVSLFKYPDRVGLTDTDVIFVWRFGRRTVVAPWNRIRPPHMKKQLGLSWVFVPAFRTEGTWIDGELYSSVNLPVNQVVEILTHPNFRYPIKPPVAESLGLVPTPDGRYVKAR